ncbi:MAG: signal peptidase II [Rickettsiaceae bacterium]|nr:signal peptidase II [Rickettsiaceae bacterium]
MRLDRLDNIIPFTIFLIISLSIDQATKIYLINHLKTLPSQEVHVFSFFKLIYSWNYGISFGMFDHYQYSNLIFLLLNSFIILYLCHHNAEIQDPLQHIAIYLIISGALGNLIDRLFHGAVFDFLHFYYGEYAFPTFNIADIYISVGAFLYFVRSILVTK